MAYERKKNHITAKDLPTSVTGRKMAPTTSNSRGIQDGSESPQLGAALGNSFTSLFHSFCCTCTLIQVETFAYDYMSVILRVLHSAVCVESISIFRIPDDEYYAKNLSNLPLGLKANLPVAQNEKITLLGGARPAPSPEEKPL